MRVIGEAERGSWLATRLRSWAVVGAVAGAGFEAYARILHPLEVWRPDTSVEDEHGLHPVQNELWRWAEVADRQGKVMHPLVQYTALVEIDTTAVFSDGWQVTPPATGWLDPDLLARLASHLGAATTTPDDLVAGVWNGWGELNGSTSSLTFTAVSGLNPSDVATERERVEAELEASSRSDVGVALSAGALLSLPGRDYLLFATSVDELADPAWVHGAGLGWAPGLPGVMPQLLWPEDRAWVVASEIDWDSTIVAGPRTLIDAVLSDDTFEAYEVTETTDLSWDGDQINRQRD